MSLDKNRLALEVGEQQTLKATVVPDDATDKTLSWSSTEVNIAIVNNNGLVTALRPGTAVIMVETSYGGHRATCTVTVTAALAPAFPVTGVSLDRSTLNVAAGETVQLSAAVQPANATNKTVTWSSDNDRVATVQDGLVTGLSAGTATITVSTVEGGYRASCTVTVRGKEDGELFIRPPTLMLTVGGASQTLTVFPREKAGLVFWDTNDPEVATVDSSGMVTPRGAGTAMITATSTDGRHSAQCEVTVRPRADDTVRVTGVTVNPPELILLPGRTGFLNASITPADATDRQVTWQSNNPAVAIVDSVRGNVTALARGEATLIVTTRDGNHTATAKVTVHAASEAKVAVTNIRLVPARLELMAGTTGNISATVYPMDATYRAVEYISDNPNIFTVDQDGTVTAHHPGTACLTVISRENPSISAVSEVTVGGQALVEPQAVILNQVRVNLVAGGSQLKLNATVLPATVINKTITWSSDAPEVATVDQQGNITPLTRGTARITATSSDGKQHAYCQVNVATAAIHVQNVDIYPQVMHLEENGAPAYARTFITPVDATNQEVEWVSADPTVAGVDAHGKITPLKPGRTVIQAITRGGDHTAAPVTAASQVFVARRWPEFTNVDPQKTWTIRFSKPLQTTADLSEHIRLTDHNNVPLEADIRLLPDRLAVEVKPRTALAPGGEYYLHIVSSCYLLQLDAAIAASMATPHSTNWKKG